MNADPNYIDLFNIVDDDGGKLELDIDFGEYAKSEREIITPALIALGYQVGQWHDGERDSFGPLSRCARVTKNNETKVVVYG